MRLEGKLQYHGGRAEAGREHRRSLTAVRMRDIDRFKAINDAFGHDFGDRVLIHISDVMRLFGKQRQVLVARHGGEEFAILMIGVTPEQAAHDAEKLRLACAAKEGFSEDMSARVTISIGLAVSHGEIDLAKIMRTADQALYTAKHRGRNGVARADATADSVAA
jgi:diguanylate cyclase (GGDEF)-like protein